MQLEEANVTGKPVRIFIETLILPVLKRHLVKHKKQLLPPFQFKRIAVMKFASLGDYVLVNQAIKALKLRYTDAKITFICDNRKNAKMFEGSPYIDDFEYIEVFDKCGNFRNPLNPRFMKELIAFYFKSWQRRFDILVNLNIVESTFVLFINMIAVYAAKAKIKIGLDTEGNGFFYDASIKDSFSGTKADLYTYLELVSLLGAGDHKDSKSILIPPEIEKNTELLLNTLMQGRKDSMVCFHPGSNVKIKMWPAASFAELGNSLIKNYGARILLIGSKTEIGLGETIASLLINEPVNFVGKTTLQELAALIKRSCLFIGNNSAPMQIAATECIPTIGIIGPGLNRYYSYRERHFRYVKSSSPCPFVKNSLECQDINCTTQECMKNIAVGDIIAVVDELQKEGIISL